jgi:flavin reductase (DIM6/NTAB) family NADH-FMN oxidoreductase RutF
MSKYLGERLPREVVNALDGRDLDGKYGETYLLLTADPEGAPRPCMLSAGEMLAIDDRKIRVALWPNGHTGANLRRGAQVVICFVAPNMVLYIHGRAKELAPGRDPEIERFEIAVSSVDSDSHEGLPVLHGIAFTSAPDVRRTMLEQWRKVLSALREG